MKAQTLLRICLVLVLASMLASCASSSDWSAPGVTLAVEPEGSAEQVSSGVQLLVLVTVLSLAPAVLILATSFTRIVIVLSLIRTALGTPTIPPNQIVVGLSLLMTFFIMSPVYKQVDQRVLQPYMNSEIDQETAF